MTCGRETITEAGQEPKRNITTNPPRLVSRSATPISETVLRLIPVERAIYILPVVLLFVSLFVGRYMMDPVETFRILVIGSANALLDGTSTLLSTLSGHQVVLPSFEQTWGYQSRRSSSGSGFRG